MEAILKSKAAEKGTGEPVNTPYDFLSLMWQVPQYLSDSILRHPSKRVPPSRSIFNLQFKNPLKNSGKCFTPRS